ncbi:Hg(II)-responsive transcriptional regulator [Methylomicrobium album]|uniref:Mercuric resistance operon regulatory protein n=1 Tax=Methylomicrobium album BG8 TaxID=686340 RepID=H8GIY7_METAL|nr:Hg(II)-responsive transcriptional regulator [Methylomicrobium album]EIC31494.1 Hg(II)-responsive transcriptional regulator [Methylomicrobium album BG8]
MAHENFTIGQLAKTTAVNVETIRYYQRRGLLAKPVKPHKGIRRYTERDARRVRFIKQGQKLGFSLDELKELMSLEDERQCQQARNIALKKLSSIRERIEGLKNMEKALSGLVECCSHNADGVSCPIIMALLNASHP